MWKGIKSRNVIYNKKHYETDAKRKAIEYWGLKYRNHEITAEEVPVEYRELAMIWLQEHPRK